MKSRAHHTRVEYCYVHHSANREFDLVDAAETARPQSDAVLLGNIIVKDPQCSGNRTVIHFGQDGGKGHNGTLYLAFNTIVTPFLAPVVELSAPKAKAVLLGNLLSDGGNRQQHQVLAVARGGASLRRRDRQRQLAERCFRPGRPAEARPGDEPLPPRRFPPLCQPCQARLPLGAARLSRLLRPGCPPGQSTCPRRRA